MAADMREKFLQGEAAGRNMAVPVNWRALEGCWMDLKKLGAAMMQASLQPYAPAANALNSVGCIHGPLWVLTSKPHSFCDSCPN